VGRRVQLQDDAYSTQTRVLQQRRDVFGRVHLAR
jgi:hypothetical protein